MSEYILEMKGIRKEFPGVVALDNVSFSVKPGVIHALIGENGAGKSTLMKCLFGVYQKNAGNELKHEIGITVADMRSGNYEAALTRFESRVGSSMLSDVTRGLIGVLRGDETEVYWSGLAVKFSDYQRQNLKQQAQKVPGKVKRLSMCLLFCFMLIYIVVIGMEIVNSIGILFG